MSRPSSNQFTTYKTFVVLAVLGLLRESDQLLRQQGYAIKRVAKYLRGKMPPPRRTLYRGMLVEPQDIPTDRLSKPFGVEFVSFSEDLQVACWFAAKDTTMADLVMMQRPSAEGWIGEYIPDEKEILFHYSWADSLTKGPGPNIFQIALDLSQSIGNPNAVMEVQFHLKNQKEVICTSGVRYPIRPVTDYTCDPVRDLDSRFIPRSDFIIAPPALAQIGIKPGNRINISQAIFHRPSQRCYQCHQPSVEMTYILEIPLVVDICQNCSYVFRNPINGRY